MPGTCATQASTRMIRDFGMSDRLGPVGFSSSTPSYLGADGRGRPYAEGTQQLIDEEVARLLREAEQRASRLLTEHRPALDRVVELLLERETIDGSEVEAAVAATGPRPARVGAG